MNDSHHNSRTPFDASASGDTTTQPLPTSQHEAKTTSLLTPSRGLNPRLKYIGASAIGAVVALALSSFANDVAQRFSAPDRAQITPVGAAQLVRSDPNHTTSTRDMANANHNANDMNSNEIAMPSAPPLDSLSEVALRNASSEDKPRLQARVDEDKAIAERQLLEDKKRSIERQLEDAAAQERRRNEDKMLEDQRANETKQRMESRAQDDKQFSEQRQAQVQITPFMTSAQ